MSLRQKYLEILAGIVPIGAAGVALLLGSSAPVAADEGPATASRAADAGSVSVRLEAIREAVSDATEPTVGRAGSQLAWAAWRNGGGGGAWRNGGARWGNGGARWGNGGARWGNGGWHNGWNNYWRNL